MLALIKIPSLLPPSTPIPKIIFCDEDVSTNNLPVMEPVTAVIAPCRNTFSVNKPKPGFVSPNNNPLLNPLKSPNRAFNSTSYIPLPVLSIISM